MAAPVTRPSVDRTRVLMAAAALLFVRATAASFAFQSDLRLGVGERLSQAPMGAAIGLVIMFPVAILLLLLLGCLLRFAARRVLRWVGSGAQPGAATHRGVWLVLGTLTFLEAVSFGVAALATGESPRAVEVLTWLAALVVAYPIVGWGVRPPEAT